MERVILGCGQAAAVLVESFCAILKLDGHFPVCKTFFVPAQRRFKPLTGRLSIDGVDEWQLVLVILFFMDLCVTFWVELLLRLNMHSDIRSLHYLHHRRYTFHTILIKVGRSISPVLKGL